MKRRAEIHQGTLSENNRRSRFWQLTRVGRTQLRADLASWHQTADIIARFLSIDVEAPL